MQNVGAPVTYIFESTRQSSAGIIPAEFLCGFAVSCQAQPWAAAPCSGFVARMGYGIAQSAALHRTGIH